MTDTARLRLPTIAATQAQKHVTHNEALVALDSLVQISVIDKDLATPPGGPTEGDCYIVAAGGTGAWTGWDDRIARYEDGAWRSFLPGAGGGEGWLAYVRDEAAFYVLNGAGDWVALVSILALGTAAFADIGSSGDAVPKLNAANAWGALQTFNTGTQVPALFVWADSAASIGPYVDLRRESGTPAANDGLGAVRQSGRNDAGEFTVYGEFYATIGSAADGAEAGQYRLKTIQAGISADRLAVGAGVFHPGATGGDKGANTINFGAVYDDNVLLTCVALQDEFLENGTVDTDAWDARVPDIEIPEQVDEVPVTEEADEEVNVLEEADGRIVLRCETRRVRRDRMVELPVVDGFGRPVLAGDGTQAVLRRTVTEKRVTPARTVARRHAVAHLFKRMLDDGFDPRDPARYIARLRADKALPGMPTQGEWEQNKLSVGEMMSRKWLALELLALVVCNHEERLAVLERMAAG